MKEISDTGYWTSETAHIHHVYSKELGEWICKFLEDEKENYIYDFGCGMGNYLKELKDNGFKKLTGFEGDIPMGRVFDNIIQQDLTLHFALRTKGNILSLEVGEHIPKEFMSVYIDNITSNCNKILITSWAIRGQEGFGHVNCLDNHEILPEFEKRGFELLTDKTAEARSIIQPYCHWFKNTIFVLKRK